MMRPVSAHSFYSFSDHRTDTVRSCALEKRHGKGRSNGPAPRGAPCNCTTGTVVLCQFGPKLALLAIV